MLSTDPSSVIKEHLQVAQSRRIGVLSRLRFESGAFVALSVGIAALGIAAPIVFSAYGLALFLIALIPSLLLAAFGLWVDRREPEPAWLLMRCVVWGATLCILVATVAAETALGFMDEGLTASVVAPVVEEAVKAVAIVWLLRHYRSHLNGRADAIVYALFVGIGFTVVEDFGYYLGASESAEDSVFETVVSRVPSTLLHPIFTSFTALGLVLASHKGGLPRFLYPLAGFAIAVILHAAWNSDIPLLIRAGVYLPLTIGFLWCGAVFASKLERDTLEALNLAGGLSPTQVDILRQVLLSPAPGVFEWVAASRDPAHLYHAKWRIVHLFWIATSPNYARELARASLPEALSEADLASRAQELLSVELDELIYKTRRVPAAP